MGGIIASVKTPQDSAAGQQPTSLFPQSYLQHAEEGAGILMCYCTYIPCGGWSVEGQHADRISRGTLDPLWHALCHKSPQVDAFSDVFLEVGGMSHARGEVQPRRPAS